MGMAQSDGRTPLLVVTVALVVVSVFLYRQNGSLRNRLNTSPPVRLLAVGMPVPAIRGWSRFSGPQVIDTSQRAYGALILVFASSCAACDRNWPYWRTLIQELKDRHDQKIVLVDLTSDADAEYLTRNLKLGQDIEAPLTLTYLSPSSAVAYGFGLTPQTLVLKGGYVSDVWTGVLNDERVTDIGKQLIGR